MALVPVLVKGNIAQIKNAIEIGTIDRTGLAYLNDTGRFAYIDSEFNINPIKTDNLWVNEKEVLPDISEGSTSTVYIIDNVGYIFNGENYTKVFDYAGVTDLIEINTNDIAKIVETIGDVDELITDDNSSIVNAINANKRSHDVDIARLEREIGQTEGAGIVTATVSSSEEYLKSYTFKQNGIDIVTVDIPKDMVVKSGSVEVNPDGKVGTYIVLVLANASEDKLYIPVDSLIENYTGQSTETIRVNVNNTTRTISAQIINGSVTNDKLAVNSVGTVNIINSSISKDKLNDALKTSINKADTSLQANDIQEGTAKGTIAVQGKKNVKVHGLGSAAYTETTEYDAAGSATKAKSELLGSSTDSSSTATIYGTRNYVDDSVREFDAKIAAKQDKLTTDSIITEYIQNGAVTGDKIASASVSKTKLDTSLSSAVDKANSALQLADIQEGTAKGTLAIQGKKNVKVHGLDTAAYKAETDFDKAGAASAVLGTKDDASSVVTVYGTRKYIDEKTILKTEKGAANGVAELDENGVVKSSQLPSYVDDVLEFATKSEFPAIGESGKIYIAVDTNVSYRWSGTQYVEISSSLALGETSSTAYAGDKGKANADAIAEVKDIIGGLQPKLTAGDNITIKDTVISSTGGGDNSRELTKAEYDALSEEEKKNGTTYYVKDAVIPPFVTTIVTDVKVNGTSVVDENGVANITGGGSVDIDETALNEMLEEVYG